MVWYIYVLYVGSPIKYNRYIGYHTLGKYVYCTYLAQRALGFKFGKKRGQWPVSLYKTQTHDKKETHHEKEYKESAGIFNK